MLKIRTLLADVGERLLMSHINMPRSKLRENRGLSAITSLLPIASHQSVAVPTIILSNHLVGWDTG